MVFRFLGIMLLPALLFFSGCGGSSSDSSEVDGGTTVSENSYFEYSNDATSATLRTIQGKLIIQPNTDPELQTTRFTVSSVIKNLVFYIPECSFSTPVTGVDTIDTREGINLDFSFDVHYRCDANTVYVKGDVYTTTSVNGQEFTTIESYGPIEINNIAPSLNYAVDIIDDAVPLYYGSTKVIAYRVKDKNGNQVQDQDIKSLTVQTYDGGKILLVFNHGNEDLTGTYDGSEENRSFTNTIVMPRGEETTVLGVNAFDYVQIFGNSIGVGAVSVKATILDKNGKISYAASSRNIEILEPPVVIVPPEPSAGKSYVSITKFDTTYEAPYFTDDFSLSFVTENDTDLSGKTVKVGIIANVKYYERPSLADATIFNSSGYVKLYDETAEYNLTEIAPKDQMAVIPTSLRKDPSYVGGWDVEDVLANYLFLSPNTSVEVADTLSYVVGDKVRLNTCLNAYSYVQLDEPTGEYEIQAGNKVSFKVQYDPYMVGKDIFVYATYIDEDGTRSGSTIKHTLKGTGLQSDATRACEYYSCQRQVPIRLVKDACQEDSTTCTSGTLGGNTIGFLQQANVSSKFDVVNDEVNGTLRTVQVLSSKTDCNGEISVVVFPNCNEYTKDELSGEATRCISYGPTSVKWNGQILEELPSY